MTLLGTFLDPLLALIYPPRCLVCRTLGNSSCLCDQCAAAIMPVPEPKCARCGHPLAGQASCRDCWHRAPAFVRGRSLGAYEGVLQDAIHRFKFHDRPGLAEPLGLRLAAFARTEASSLHGLAFDALVPVPMHPLRQRLRGYNQSERLARVVARELGLPVQSALLMRSRLTRPQVGLNAHARRSNVQGAFAVPHPSEAAGRTLLLIDDVTTTSTTLHCCAEALKDAGAQGVYALTLAAG